MKIEIRDNCKVCGGELPNSRFRTYCSEACRTKHYNKKYAERIAKYNKERRDKIASIADPKRKCQCLICGKHYTQVGTHIVQVHGITAREYREQFGLEVKRGITPKWYRGQKGIGVYPRSQQTLEKLSEERNKAYQNAKDKKEI